MSFDTVFPRCYLHQMVRFPSRIHCLVFLGSLAASLSARGGCCIEETDSQAFERSRSVARVEVSSTEAFHAPDGTIHTRVTLKTLERFKGDLPDQVEIVTPGGTLDGRSDFRSDSLSLDKGKSYILMLNRAGDGSWSARSHRAYRAVARDGNAGAFFRKRARGVRPELIPATAPETGTAEGQAGVPGSVVTATGYSETNLQPTRFITCDGDEPIPYLIDIDPSKLPVGMSQAGALAAVAEALQAWASASSLKFRYEGTVSFNVAASSISIQDGRLRIQLHDNHNAINENGVLGIGGGGFFAGSSVLTGGRVGATQGFQERFYGYVVLESATNAPFLQTINNFKRVLTHEIGHALGLSHSSNNPSEPNSILKEATMYFTASPGSAGATIQTYDTDRIQFGYPVANTPPFTVDRTLQSITTSNFSLLPAAPGVNRIRLQAIDRQGNTLTPVLISSSNNNGVFSLSGNTLIYTPNANFGEASLTADQIQAGSSFDNAVFSFSDGTNLSRYASCIMTGFSRDTTPSDGLPDAWMNANFGTATVGAVGSNRHPDSDPDRDGLSNRVEWYLNTDPNSASSGPIQPVYNHSTRQLTYTPVRFAPYSIESSSDLNSWTLRGVGTLYQSSGTLTSTFSGTVPAKEFFRVVTGP